MSAPVISVLLPTVRPHKLATCLPCIGPACGTVPYEVVIVADFAAEVVPPCCQWIVRERRGVVDAVNLACAAAQGEYWFLFNDESVLSPRALETLHRHAVMDPGTLWTVNHQPPYAFVYYGKPFAPFPFAHRDLIAKIGGLLDPVYRGFYSDPDLSMRAHAAGVAIKVVSSAVLQHNNQHDAMHQHAVNTYLAADRATFQARWNHLGEFCDP